MPLSERRVQPGHLLSLVPFTSPAGGATVVLRATAERAGGCLRLRYVLGGPVAEIRIPGPAAYPQRTDGLWEHTCLETFIAPAGHDAYWELNLAPSGNWNAYRFDRHRAGMRSEQRARAPLVAVERASCGTLTLRAELDLAPLPELATAPLDVGLAAVLEACDGTPSYWALEHGAGARPDFHRRESFVLRLDAETST